VLLTISACQMLKVHRTLALYRVNGSMGLTSDRVMVEW